MEKVTILRRDKDRSYTNEIINIEKEDNHSIYFRSKYGIIIDIKKSIIRSRESATFFKEKAEEFFEYKLVKIDINKRTGDKSFVNEWLKVIAENQTHLQIIYKFPWGLELIYLVKEEYNITRWNNKSKNLRRFKMNREEAKSRLNLLLNEGQSPYDLIDRMHDDFESRTCENCEYSNSTLISDVMLCDKKVSSTHGAWKSEINKDFGCNKFKRKTITLSNK